MNGSNRLARSKRSSFSSVRPAQRLHRGKGRQKAQGRMGQHPHAAGGKLAGKPAAWSGSGTAFLL